MSAYIVGDVTSYYWCYLLVVTRAAITPTLASGYPSGKILNVMFVFYYQCYERKGSHLLSWILLMQTNKISFKIICFFTFIRVQPTKNLIHQFQVVSLRWKSLKVEDFSPPCSSRSSWPATQTPRQNGGILVLLRKHRAVATAPLSHNGLKWN